MITEERETTVVQALDKSELTELSSVRVRKDGQKQPDLEALRRQTKNPYCYRVGKWLWNLIISITAERSMTCLR